MEINGKVVVVTGGTDGIGAATALEFKRRGAHVWIIGRSQAKGERVIAAATQSHGSGSVQFIQADFSRMATVLSTVVQLQQGLPHIDILIHCVGILIAHKAYTDEGIEQNLAVSYLSRFVMTKALVEHRILGQGSLMLNLAASGPRIPKMARMEFDDLTVVEARYGMRSHGQAQLANDLFSLEAAQRWGLSVIGYGPGSVDTSIRRELPQVIVTLMKPFFAFSTRTPAQVGLQLAEFTEQQSPPPGATWFFTKKGRFEPDPFVLAPERRSALWSISEALERKVLTARSTPDVVARKSAAPLR